jgi:hypothetical protein
MPQNTHFYNEYISYYFKIKQNVSQISTFETNFEYIGSYKSYES